MKRKILIMLLFMLFWILTNLGPNVMSDILHLHYDECDRTPGFYSGTAPNAQNPYGTGDTVFDALRMVLPDGTKPMSTNGYRLNYKLWHDKGIVVYGDYRSIAGNRTKGNYSDQTQINDGAPETKDGGYYYVSEYEAYGEYRYHGYDAVGNLYTNINFPNDATTKNSLSSKNWLYMPWINTNPKIRQNVSPWNAAAMGESNTSQIDQSKTQQWINALYTNWGVPKENAIKTGYLPDNVTRTTNIQNNELYNFVHVLSPPSALAGGEGRMWHKTGSGSIWYQTFSIPNLKDQHIKTGTASCTVEILNQNELRSKIPAQADDASQDHQPIMVKVRVSGRLNDDAYYNDQVKKVIYYTRYDIKQGGGWSITLDGSNMSTLQGSSAAVNINSANNTAYADFTRVVTIGEARGLTNGSRTFHGMVKINFADNVSITASNQKSAAFQLIPMEDQITEPTKDILKDPPPKTVIPNPSLPKPAFDIVKYPASDATDMTDCAKRIIKVDGETIDDVLFFSGNWIWGEGNDGLKFIEIEYISTEGVATGATFWLYVYPTKPNAHFTVAGSYKENRVMTFTDNSIHANIQIVAAYYPITQYEWKYSALEQGTLETVMFKDISQLQKKIMYKAPGTYQVELIVTNTLGRRSDPYRVDFTIFEDYKPVILCNLDNSVMARNEPITANIYEAVSTDGDIIAANTVELWYDSDNNGSFDELINTWNHVTEYPNYTPTKLGNYKFINTVTEAFGEETFPEFIAADDYRQTRSEREFFVDNYVPMTDIYIDIPMVRTYVDAFFMLDEKLTPEKLQYVIDNRMNINNALRLKNLAAKVENWDLRTYTYSQPASTALNTGTTYPSINTIYSSNGFSGTLNRSNVSDNGSYVDQGAYATKMETQYFSDSWLNNSTGSGWTNPWEVVASSENPAPESMPVNSDGYTGVIPKIGTTTNYESGYVYGTQVNGRTPWSYSNSYTANYGGTLTKPVQIWVPNILWESNYTGFYSGTIYKNMKAPYIDPFVATHKKYTVYVSDGEVNNMTDLTGIMNNHDTRLILIGNPVSASQIEHDYFILNDGTQPIDQLINQAVNWIIQQNPYGVEGYLTTQNQPFNMYTSDFDQEGDEITNPLFQYVHEVGFFDNPTGLETGANADYHEEVGWTTTKEDSFANVGRFTIYRKIQDTASTDPNFEEFNKTSGTPYLNVTVHRIPIANAEMTWKYNVFTNLYELTFIDHSYDLDHQTSREDRGIVATQIRYRKDTEEWNYKMPTDLSWGSYTIEYFVQDVEQAWSDPYTMKVDLLEAPPATISIESIVIQKEVRLRGEDTIPASEVLQIMNPEKRGGPIIRSNVPITSAEVLVNGSRIGYLTLAEVHNETEYIYNTDVFEYRVPAEYADGDIHITVRAGTTLGNQWKDRGHDVGVYTPVWEDYSQGRLAYITSAISGVPEHFELSGNTTHEKLNDFKVITSKYASKIEISIGGITFYIFNNATAGGHAVGSGATATFIYSDSSAQYKVDDIAVNLSAEHKEWTFKLSAVNNKPLIGNTSYDLCIKGFDESGSASATFNKHGYNPQLKTITTNSYLLYGFRVTMIRDLHLESFYSNITGKAGQPQYVDKPMFVNSMAIDPVNFGGMIDGLTKGYKFEFEIDSKGFNDVTDTIVIQPHFYTADVFVRDEEERDLYWEDSNHRILPAGEGGHSPWKNITLTISKRTVKAGDEAIWKGEYLIPGTAWAVPKGTSYAQAKARDLKRDIIVNFHIRGYKNGILQFDYNAKQWGKERTISKYPYVIGDVIKYSWKKNCLEDIKAKDNR